MSVSAVHRFSPGRTLFRPGSLFTLLLLTALSIAILAPLAKIAVATLVGQGLEAWYDVVAGAVSRNLLWRPLGNSLIVGVVVAVATVAIGGFLAWLVVLTDVPCRKFLGTLAVLPYVIPSFAAAFAWAFVFRNETIGGQLGLLEVYGVDIPDWLAWGMAPTIIVLSAHYYSLAFLLIASAFAMVAADVIEAAEMTGAGRGRILTGITLPIVAPAIVSAVSLIFAGAVSNFAAPALLGLPVGMHTLSTRVYGMISTGQVERGYVLSLILVAFTGMALWYANRAISGRASYATVTGKGGRRRRFPLGRWRWLLFSVALGIGLLSTIAPLAVLVLSSLVSEGGGGFGNLTLHYWIGLPDPDLAQGQPGFFRNSQNLSALGVTLAFGGSVAIVSIILGLAVSYATGRKGQGPLTSVLAQVAFIPALLPGIAFGAAYVALFAQPIGPYPALYGTFALLVIAGSAYTLPYAVQSGRAAIAQIAADIEESAVMTGAGVLRRIAAIFLPLAIRGLLAGAVLVFVKIVRDLSLVVLLFTPSLAVLSVVAYRYASEGFLQLGNVATVVIVFISLGATLLAEYLQGKNQPWMKD